MRLYSAGIANKVRDFPLALLRPYSVTGFTPPDSPMKRGAPASHYSARCWDGLFLRQNLLCNTDRSVRTTPPDPGKGFYSAGFCNEIKCIPLAVLRPRLERACTTPPYAGAQVSATADQRWRHAAGGLWRALRAARVAHPSPRSSPKRIRTTRGRDGSAR